ncbi:MAG: electron transfer flavoprotein subunit alpha/FixB family protein [Gemmatimonadaceae bacterium]
MTNVLAFAETRGGTLRKVALETATAARTLASDIGGEVHAVVLVASSADVAAASERLGRHGADVVIVVAHDGFERYNPEAAAAFLAERLGGESYRAVIFSATAQGRDLAPRVAAKLRLPLAADVTALEVSGDKLTATHPMSANKLVATLELAATPALVSLRPSAVTPAESPREGRVEKANPAGDPAASRVVVTELHEGNSGKLDLSEAPIIVSGGRGLKGPENFTLVEALAEAFGRAAVGCTRAVTDDGWRPHSDQIGQTGRVVSPELYVAVGISGAIQHLAGMRASRTIVAINRDREAPIFKIADYGIVGDAFEIVPALTQAVKEARADAGSGGQVL